jgi:hypothetical protein
MRQLAAVRERHHCIFDSPLDFSLVYREDLLVMSAIRGYGRPEFDPVMPMTRGQY